MSTPRDIRLSPDDLALKLAFAEAVKAAGGQVFCAREVGRAQSRLSDWCSTSTADFAPADVVRRIEALGAGSPGHPHVTRALARAAGVPLGALSASAPPADCEDLGDWLASATTEFAHVAQALAGADLEQACNALSARRKADIGREAGELIDVLQQLRRALDTG